MNDLFVQISSTSEPLSYGEFTGTGHREPELQGDNGHGVVILESLLPGRLPLKLEGFIERTYQHWLGGSRLTTIAIITIPAQHVRDTAECISRLLRPKGFYAHIVWKGKLLVIFPNAVYDVAPSDAAGIASLRSIGAAHGIPERQMCFEYLVANDHPNQSQNEPTSLVNPTEFFSASSNTEHSNDVRMCGRVLTVTADGLVAQLIANGTVTKVEFPNMPGPSVGDIIGCKGGIRQGNGEQILYAIHWATLTPTQRPELFERDSSIAPREITLLRDTALRHALDVRRQVIRTVRAFLDDRGFLEMETPIILPVRDIAPVPHFSVSPTTHETAVLRICPENALKRLVVAGFDKVYEIARNFRIENPTNQRSCEFTTLECYQAYATYHQTMDLCQELILEVNRAVNSNTDVLRFQGATINIKAPWERQDFQTAVFRETDINLEQTPDLQTLQNIMEARGISARGLRSRRECVNYLAEIVEQQIVTPTFLMDHPVETICVAQRHEAPRSHLLQRFELFIGGMEVAHAFAELTNPIEQRMRMQHLMKEKIAAGEAVHQFDEDFLTTLDIGLPPTGGLGIGIDRLVMLLTDEPIDRVVAFPTCL